MSSLTTCLKKATALPDADKDAILERVSSLRDQGLSPHDAAVRAVEERLQSVRDQMAARPSPEAAKVDTASPVAFSRLETLRNSAVPGGYLVRDFLESHGKLSWWDKSVGTQHNLAKRNPLFRRVFESVQNFIGDTSFYATQAANLAPTVLPRLETWKDIAKSPLSAEDTKALSAPVFEGTLVWTRDQQGRPVRVDELVTAAEGMDSEAKARELLRRGAITADKMQRMQHMPLDTYEGWVRNQYEQHVLKAGIVWSDAELRSQFNLSPEQIALYREVRSAIDKSLTNLAISDMLHYGGKDIPQALRAQVLDMDSVDDAAVALRDALYEQGQLDAARKAVLDKSGDVMIEKADRVKDLMQRGYAPLSRFGHYTVYVGNGTESQYFSMFETQYEANAAARRLRVQFPDSEIRQGTLSEDAYKAFAGITPETLELFGGSLGLEAQGDGVANEAFQEYLKLAKSTRSAMKRLIERKGTAGFSEDVGRVLAGFVYSNARQTSSNLNMPEMAESVVAIPNTEGELRDHAQRLTDYVRNPQEEAQKVRGLLFAQYLGGSVASALVNLTQPFTMTLPYLSQYGGAIRAGQQMRAALADALKRETGDAALDAALKKAEELGIVSPQEVHQLIGQAVGKASLKSGDGTLLGNTSAMASNTLSKVMLGWGKVFSTPEQFNRRITFIAAYRTAVAQNLGDPAAFAKEAVGETQGVYNKGNKPKWARGAWGSTIFTFKQFGIAYVELIGRMANSGPDGRRAALFAMAILMMAAGADGLPFEQDLEDIIDGIMQKLGYNWQTRLEKRQALAALLGEQGAQFVLKGVTGLPGVPFDAAGRLGLGNLIPATGLFVSKADHTNDVLELAGPVGDLLKRAGTAVGQTAGGDVLGAAKSLAPRAITNAIQGADMASTGMYRDKDGYKVIDTDAAESAFKFIGFQPASVARIQEANFLQRNMISMAKATESDLAQRIARARFEGDPEAEAEARADLRTWNERNPDTKIAIKSSQINSRVANMRLSKAERIAKTAPKEMRESVRKELEKAAP